MITETIPCHKDYQVVLQNEKLYFRKVPLFFICQWCLNCYTCYFERFGFLFTYLIGLKIILLWDKIMDLRLVSAWGSILWCWNLKPSGEIFLWLLVPFKQRLFDALNELEALKPDVQHLLEELNKRNRSQVNRLEQIPQDGSLDDSFERPSFRRLTLKNNIVSQVLWSLIVT